MIKKCLICHKDFKTYSFLIAKGYGKYCSSQCYGRSMVGKPSSHPNKKGICLNTGKTHFKKGFTPWNKNTKGVMKAWNKGKRFPEKLGKNNSNWKGGTTKSGGYILVHSPNHPFCDAHNYVKRSRLVMEKHIGRYLLRTEIVHHINEIKSDDRIKNLKLFPSESEHQMFHHKK